MNTFFRRTRAEKHVRPLRYRRGPTVPGRCLSAEIPRLHIHFTLLDKDMQGVDPSAIEALSHDRLEGFRSTAMDEDKLLVGRYLLNAAISEALHPLLHALEVVLRNRINDAASAKYPVDPELRHTYGQFPSWLDAINGPVATRHESIVQTAKDDVYKQLRRRFGPSRAAARQMYTPGRLVAALPFSFWVFLFDQVYSGTRDAPGSLWPDLLQPVFPYCQQPHISQIRKRLRRLLVVRNRTMHYERLYPYEDGKGVPWDPYEIRSDIIELLEWMHPRVATVAQTFDRIPEVMHPANLRFMRWIPWRY